MRTWEDLFVGLGPASASSVAPSELQDEGGRWFRKFRDSLSRSRQAMVQQIAVVAFDPADHATWERIEEGLIGADVGVTSTVTIVERLEGRGGRRSPDHGYAARGRFAHDRRRPDDDHACEHDQPDRFPDCCPDGWGERHG